MGKGRTVERVFLRRFVVVSLLPHQSKNVPVNIKEN